MSPAETEARRLAAALYPGRPCRATCRRGGPIRGEHGLYRWVVWAGVVTTPFGRGLTEDEAWAEALSHWVDAAAKRVTAIDTQTTELAAERARILAALRTHKEGADP